MKKIFLFSLIILVVFISGCTTGTPDSSKLATEACIKECKSVKDSMNLNDGPCLSNKIIDDWVCDVAHSPRQSVDNDPTNQCPEYGKSAKHFVEVDQECKFIRAV
jgi:hypothetical protein